eukprot:803157-Rhodomonas_salina.1
MTITLSRESTHLNALHHVNSSFCREQVPSERMGSLSVEQVKAVFERYGTVEKCVLMKPESGKARGTIRYLEYADARRAKTEIMNSPNVRHCSGVPRLHDDAVAVAVSGVCVASDDDIDNDHGDDAGGDGSDGETATATTTIVRADNKRRNNNADDDDDDGKVLDDKADGDRNGDG